MVIALDEIAQELALAQDDKSSIEIHGVCGLSDNLEKHLSFIGDERMLADAVSSAIPAFITRPGCEVEGKANLFHDNPEFAIARVASLFQKSSLTQQDSIHETAIVDPTAKLARGVRLGPNAIVGAHATIGANTVIHGNVTIMDRVVIGEECIVYPGCVVREDCIVGDRVILQPGVVIGGDGFGFVPHNGEHFKIPQLGNVVVESDVEIGANSSIDRGRFTATRIGKGTKIDDAVMIAHNVQIGERCLIVAQCGISGSSKLGDEVVLAGQVGLVGHISIADNVTLLGQSMATKDIRESGVWAGSPARPAKQWKRAFARLYAGLSKT